MTRPCSSLSVADHFADQLEPDHVADRVADRVADHLEPDNHTDRLG